MNEIVGENAVYLRKANYRWLCGEDAAEHLSAFRRSCWCLGGRASGLNALYLGARKEFKMHLGVPSGAGWLPSDDTISWICNCFRDSNTGSRSSVWCQRALTSALSSSKILSITPMRIFMAYLSNWELRQCWENRAMLLHDINRIIQDVPQIPNEMQQWWTVKPAFRLK